MSRCILCRNRPSPCVDCRHPAGSSLPLTELLVLAAAAIVLLIGTLTAVDAPSVMGVRP